MAPRWGRLWPFTAWPRPNSPLTLGNLTKVASNANDANANGWPGVSRVNFQTVAGTTYLIQIEGKIVAGTTNEGYVVLNWQPSVYGGTITFATNLNNFGQEDNTLLVVSGENFGGLTNVGVDELGPSLMNTNVLNMATNFGSTAALGQGRITVVRTGGYNGRIQVDIIPTADYYQNTYTTNIWTTNIYIGPSDANGVPLTGPAASPSTNITITYTNFYFYLGYDVAGINSATPYELTNYGVLLISNVVGVLEPRVCGPIGPSATAIIRATPAPVSPFLRSSRPMWSRPPRRPTPTTLSP